MSILQLNCSTTYQKAANFHLLQKTISRYTCYVSYRPEILHGTLFYPYTCCTKREAQSENFLKYWPSLIYMVEESINTLWVSAMTCFISVFSITGEKTSSFKTIFVNLNICGTLKTNFWFLIRCKSGLWSKFPKNVVLINSLIIKFLIVNKGWFWKVCHWGAENDRFQTL